MSDRAMPDGNEVRFTAPGIADAEVIAPLSAVGADVEVHDDLGTVSVVSVGIARKPAITARALTTLEAAGIEPHLVTTTPGRVSAHISAALVDRAVQLLHGVFIPQAQHAGVTVASDWRVSELVSNTPVGNTPPFIAAPSWSDARRRAGVESSQSRTGQAERRRS